MHRLTNILLLFFAVHLSLTAAGAKYLTGGYGFAGPQPGTSQHQIPSQSPADQPFLFGIHQQAESTAEIGNRLPLPHSNTERSSNPFGGSPPEFLIEQQGTICLCASNQIEPGLPVYKLIYPFHFFM